MAALLSADDSDLPQFLDAGQNPRPGIVFHYYLDEQPNESVVLNIRNSDGDLIRSFSSQAAGEAKSAILTSTAGLNRFHWNLRFPGAVDVVDALDSWRRPDGPMVAPGHYLAELVLDGETFAQNFEVQADPRVEASPAAFEQQLTMLLQIRDRLSQNNELINRLAALKSQVQTWATRIDGPTVSAAAILDEVNDLLPALINIGITESQLYPSGLHEKLNALFESVDSADYAPPQQAHDVMRQLSAELDRHINHVQTVLAERAGAFNAAIREAGLEAVDL